MPSIDTARCWTGWSNSLWSSSYRCFTCAGDQVSGSGLPRARSFATNSSSRSLNVRPLRGEFRVSLSGRTIAPIIAWSHYWLSPCWYGQPESADVLPDNQTYAPVCFHRRKGLRDLTSALWGPAWTSNNRPTPSVLRKQASGGRCVPHRPVSAFRCTPAGRLLASKCQGKHRSMTKDVVAGGATQGGRRHKSAGLLPSGNGTNVETAVTNRVRGTSAR